MTKITARIQLIYVAIMTWLIGRLLEAASHVDKKIQSEVVALPEAFRFSMGSLPDGPKFIMKKQVDGRLCCLRKKNTNAADLIISFKHVKHAFLVFSFQEGTARSFTNERILLDGEINLAMIIVRCLDRMEALVLPRFIAVKALKRYPPIRLSEKLVLALKIYMQFLMGLFRRR
jgi:hypothetical protein